MNIEKLKDIVQDSHLNFLIGSGLSSPYLATLGNVENLLRELDNDDSLTLIEAEIMRTSILSIFFELVLLKNLDILDESDHSSVKIAVYETYVTFLKSINEIISKRKSSLLHKQVNIFTTNVDIFIEKALEDNQIEYNDGFKGRFRPVFSLSNFRKSLFKKSIHYDLTSELPMVNLLKIHGSLTWKTNNNRIEYSDLTDVNDIKMKWEAVKNKGIKINKNAKLLDLRISLSTVKHDSSFTEFLNCYKKLAIVNPTMEKFHDTLLNINYYELLRLFSNEMEKENTLLFIMGFSLSDEHIREIVLRAANSNPTLLINILAYDSEAKIEIETNIKEGNTELVYNNINIIEPPDKKNFDFKTINEEIFLKLLAEIGK